MICVFARRSPKHSGWLINITIPSNYVHYIMFQRIGISKEVGNSSFKNGPLAGTTNWTTISEAEAKLFCSAAQLCGYYNVLRIEWGDKYEMSRAGECGMLSTCQRVWRSWIKVSWCCARLIDFRGCSLDSLRLFLTPIPMLLLSCVQSNPVSFISKRTVLSKFKINYLSMLESGYFGKAVSEFENRMPVVGSSPV
jgi:hypothetical protein